MSKKCNCRETSDFMAQVRKAYADKMVLWQNKAGDVFTGTENQAKQRLSNGKIECYIVPVMSDDGVTFKAVTDIPKPKVEPDKKNKNFKNTKAV